MLEFVGLPFDEADLNAAVRHVLRRFPVLRSRIHQRGADQLWLVDSGTGAASMPPIDVAFLPTKHASSSNSDSDDDELPPLVRQVLQRHFGTPFAFAESVWRVSLVRPEATDSSPTSSFYLVLCYDHTVMDGTAAMSVFSEIERYLRAVRSHDAAAVAALDAAPAHPFLPPLAEFVPPCGLLEWTTHVLKCLAFSLFLPLILRYVPLPRPAYPLLPAPSPDTPDARRTRWLYRELSVDDSRRLLQRCRQESTTITAAIVAAAIESVHHQQASKVYEWSSNFSVRPHLKPPVDHELVGSFFGYEHLHCTWCPSHHDVPVSRE